MVAATSSRLCAASEISASEPLARPAAPLPSVIATLATIDQIAARSLRCSWPAADLVGAIWLISAIPNPASFQPPPFVRCTANATKETGHGISAHDGSGRRPRPVARLLLQQARACREPGGVENEKGRYTLVFLAARTTWSGPARRRAPLVELTYNWDEHEYQGGRNFGHLAYRVDDIYATCRKLMAAGVTINRPPRDGNMAFVRSPDNISIELLQRGEAKAPAEPWASMPNTGVW